MHLASTWQCVPVNVLGLQGFGLRRLPRVVYIARKLGCNCFRDGVAGGRAHHHLFSVARRVSVCRFGVREEAGLIVDQGSN